MRTKANIIRIEDFARQHADAPNFARHWSRHFRNGVRLDERDGWVIFEDGAWRQIRSAHELALVLGNVPKMGVA